MQKKQYASENDKTWFWTTMEMRWKNFCGKQLLFVCEHVLQTTFLKKDHFRVCEHVCLNKFLKTEHVSVIEHVFMKQLEKPFCVMATFQLKAFSKQKHVLRIDMTTFCFVGNVFVNHFFMCEHVCLKTFLENKTIFRCLATFSSNSSMGNRNNGN